jgi:pyridoxamine 5'-phosphate oxidase
MTSDNLDPISLFAEVYARAAAAGPFDHTAVTLATADSAGRPTARVVLLKGFDESGFRIFTNYNSRKGRDLEVNPRCALCFYWPSLNEQVRVEGTARRLSDEESDGYFWSRPRGSQIGAWASRQSQPLASREELEKRFAELEKEFEGKVVPRPADWGGYLIVPDVFEFWRDAQFRLHHRRRFERTRTGWSSTLLYP